MTDEEKGILYLCATPIGNLEDITFRALRTLKEVDLIAAEDTRHTKKLLNHFEITTPLTSYHKFNKESKGETLLQKLLEGKKIALVSDAGMPGISDPGYELVKLVLENGIVVTPIPGASAVTTALAASGLDTGNFYFHGFLSSKKKEREKELQKIKNLSCTLIFYESPHRIKDTLQSLENVLGKRQVVVAREMTKKFEEFLRGETLQVLNYLQEKEIKGEFTVLVEGAVNEEKPQEVNLDVLAREIIQKAAEGVHKNEEIKRVAKLVGIPKRQLYEAVVKIEKEKKE